VANCWKCIAVVHVGLSGGLIVCGRRTIDAVTPEATGAIHPDVCA
jgi:hypothetical protein